MIERSRTLPSAFAAAARNTSRLILALLLVRLLYGVLAVLLLSTAGWLIGSLNAVYIFFTYLISAVLIWRERARLPEYRMGRLAVYIFIFSIPYLLILDLLGLGKINTLQIITTWALLPVSLWLLASMARDHKRVLANPRRLPVWLFIGLLVGVAGGILSGYLLKLQYGGLGMERAPIEWLLLPTIQISTAAIQEEPLFRGFLWGYLERKGWRVVWIWLAQAVLFWVGHIYYLGRGHFSLWLIVPLMGLIFGMVAWRSRDTAPSMITHGLTNGIGIMFSGT